MSDRVTSADVARLAGVSQSAVSRVFTPGRSASGKTVAAVRAAADQLGYSPNVLARSMATGRSRMIGLVVAHIDNQFYPGAVERLSRLLQAQGYHILMFLAEGGAAVPDDVLRQVLDYQVDGIITASVDMSDALTQRCADAGIPVVMFNRGQDDPRISQVTSDNIAGARAATEALIAAGHRRIAHLSGVPSATTGRDRAAGFAQAMAAAGLVPHAVREGGFDRDQALAAVRAMFRDGQGPNAIFAGGDMMAMAALDCLRGELGLRVPQDVSVIGYDDVPIASWPVYDLTTVQQPVDAMAEATVQLMLGALRQDRPVMPQKIQVAAPLIWRGSARKPAGML